jgi:hypothetical protein
VAKRIFIEKKGERVKSIVVYVRLLNINSVATAIAAIIAIPVAKMYISVGGRVAVAC